MKIEDVNLLQNKYHLAKVFSYLLSKNYTTQKHIIDTKDRRQCFMNALEYSKNNNVHLCWGILCTEESGSLKLNLHAFCLKDKAIIDPTYIGHGLYVYEKVDKKFKSLNDFKEYVLIRIYKINSNNETENTELR